MSYNTRRSTGFSSTPQQQNAASVGQRRPVVTNNFVPGGQLAGSQQKPSAQPQQQQQQQQQQRTPQQQQAGINFRNQAGQQQGQQQQSYQTQSYSTQQSQQQARYQQGQVKQEPRPAQQQSQAGTPAKPAPSQPAPVLPGANPPAPENGENMETNADGTKKKFWFKNRGRISKAEKVRRRNMRLSKILQPKNAVMILNELIKGCQYNVEELPVKVDANQFKATVTFEHQEFAGTGRTKNGAKNSAAETALKYLIKNKQLNLKKDDDADGDEKMEISDEDGTQVMPWSHIASFAMYKLFSTWGEDTSMVNRVSAQELMGATPKPAGNQLPGTRAELKPAKKMPDNPETINPLMLMNQMLPGAQWDEVGKTGVPPNVVFTFCVTVDGKKFTGTGSSKKTAKKLAAFAACHDILKINYPADVWVPLY